MEKRSVQSLYAVTLNPNDIYRVNLSLDSLEVCVVCRVCVSCAHSDTMSP
jgi:hypothetical protein